MNSAFESWFIAQHGKRPGLKTMTDEHLRKMLKDGEYARRALAAREEWEVRYESALYAWTAQEKQRTGEDG